MKFESFAVTSNGGSGDNRENYFLNGFCKDEIEEPEAYEANLAFGKRDMYAISNGIGSDELVGGAALSVVNLLRDFLGSDFEDVYNIFFDIANKDVAGRIFENKGRKEFAGVAILCVNRRNATVYNIGDNSVFVCDGNGWKKISGKAPETVEIEESSVDGADNLIVRTFEKGTVPLLGEDSSELVVCPYVSEEIRISSRDTFLLCSKGITDNLTEAEIKGILKDKRKPLGEKANELMRKATKKGGENTNATAVLVGCRRGFDLSWIRAKWFVGIMICLILLLICLASGEKINKDFKAFFDEYVWDERKVEDIEIGPWVPKAPEEMFEYVEVTDEEQTVAEEADATEKTVTDTEDNAADVKESSQNTPRTSRKSSDKPGTNKSDTTKEQNADGRNDGKNKKQATSAKNTNRGSSNTSGGAQSEATGQSLPAVSASGKKEPAKQETQSQSIQPQEQQPETETVKEQPVQTQPESSESSPVQGGNSSSVNNINDDGGLPIDFKK